jgi:5-methylcytosine-specific restriction endonuclease McrA
VTAFPKPGIVRLKPKDRGVLRVACFVRDDGRCTRCGKRVWLKGPPSMQMHMAHVRNKRMYGDTLENVTTVCQDCHLVGMHNPKSVPPKEHDIAS